MNTEFYNDKIFWIEPNNKMEKEMKKKIQMNLSTKKNKSQTQSKVLISN